MSTLYTHRSLTILESLNIAIDRLAKLEAALPTFGTECEHAIRAKARIEFARDLLLQTVVADVQAEPTKLEAVA